MAVRFSPRCVNRVPMPSFSNVAPAASAASTSSPGMNRRTARRANHSFGIRSRSQAFDAIQSRIRRIRARLLRSVAPDGVVALVGSEEAKPAAEHPELAIDQLVERLEALERGLGLEEPLPPYRVDLDDSAQEI